ncbi:hypothetical protein ACLESD_03365 [Pyxidicoccus sp. 3LFB2]
MNRLFGWRPFLGALSLQLACATSPDATRYAQSLDSATNGCLRNPACYTQQGADAVLPWVSRATRATGTALATLKSLEAAEVARVEQLLIQCAREADAEVNEREYGPGKRPNDAECERVVRHENGKPVLRRMELGTMKHAVAFACVRRELLKLFPDNVSIEPRYGLDARTGRYVLTQQWRDSLMPDVVLHFTRQPARVQCVYDFKFPCSTANKSDPLGSAGVSAQLARYQELGGNCPPAIVTPQLGLNRE